MTAGDEVRPAPRFALEHAVQRVDLTPKARRVALVIGVYIGNDTGEARPGRRTLADLWGVNQRQLQAGVEELVAAGMIAVDKRVGAHGTDVYRSRAIGFTEDGSVLMDDGRLLASPRQRTRIASADSADDGTQRTRIASADDGGGEAPADAKQAPADANGNPADAYRVQNTTITNTPIGVVVEVEGSDAGRAGPLASSGPSDRRPAPAASAQEVVEFINAVVRPVVEASVAASDPIDTRSLDLAALIEPTRSAMAAGATPAMVAQRMREPFTKVKNITAVVAKRMTQLAVDLDDDDTAAVLALVEERGAEWLNLRRRIDAAVAMDFAHGLLLAEQYALPPDFTDPASTDAVAALSAALTEANHREHRAPTMGAYLRATVEWMQCYRQGEAFEDVAQKVARLDTLTPVQRVDLAAKVDRLVTSTSNRVAMELERLPDLGRWHDRALNALHAAGYIDDVEQYPLLVNVWMPEDVIAALRLIAEADPDYCPF